MLKRLSFFFLSLAYCFSAQAYDEDTHFYGTYAMARYAGIKHEIAVKIAMSAQWMDESYISDPTSMILLIGTGIKKRRLLHFPSSRVVGKLNTETQKQLLGAATEIQQKIQDYIAEFAEYQGDGEAVSLVTKTMPGHPVATELLMRGLKQGNLMMAAASLHVLEDSYAHAGTSAEKGHSEQWHWPDRPFDAVDKYFLMARNVFDALVAIRGQLPPDAIDCSVRLVGGTACTMNGEDLAQGYNSNKFVRAVVGFNPLRDPRYIKVAVQDLYERAAKLGYINLSQDEFDTILADIRVEWPMDSFVVLQKVLQKIFAMQMQLDAVPGAARVVFDGQKVLKDIGFLTTDSGVSAIDYMNQYAINAKTLSDIQVEGLQLLTKALAHDLLLWRVPIAQDEYNRFELEDDSSVMRKTEMDIRIENMQRLIFKLFNTKIKFVNSNSSKFAGFIAEVNLNKAAEPTPAMLDSSDGYERVTYNLAEKHAFDHMIFNYLYPSLKPENLTQFAETLMNFQKLETDWTDYLAKRKQFIAERPNSHWLTVHAQLFFGLDREYKHLFGTPKSVLKGMFQPMVSILKTFLRDELGANLTPSHDTLAYRNPVHFAEFKRKAKEAGKPVPSLLSEADFWKAKDFGMRAAPGLNPQ